MTEDKRAISPPLPSEPSAHYPIPHMSPTQDAAPDPEHMQERATRTPSTVASVPQEAAATLYRADSKRSSMSSSSNPNPNSNPNPKMRSPRPISDVVNEAFQDSPAKNHIDPEMIKLISAQVTEQVMKNLAQQQAAGTNPLASSQQPSPQSATQSTFDSLPPRSAPPTPELRRTDHYDEPPSPEHPQFDARAGYGQRSEDWEWSPDTTQRRGAARPEPITVDPSNIRRAPAPANSASPLLRQDSRVEGPPSARRTARTDSKSSEAAYDEAPRSGQAKPAPLTPDTEETAVERAWQPLFIDGNPTLRLSSFLRGLALHLIDDYDPKGSLVITPSKMLRFFNETKVDGEHYPWYTIFGKLTHSSLSNVYRKMSCPHHLIQKTYQDPPVIPGLTTWGFEYFMTCLIKAHPDTEFERLAKAVVNMPISSADDRTHRFPKELSRRLLPPEPNIPAQQKLVFSLNHEPSVIAELKGKVAMPPPPASTPPVQATLAGSLPERQRQPYCQTSQRSGFLEDDDLSSPNVPKERERKPYPAREGAGKSYPTEESRPPLSQYKPESGGTRHSRSNSGIPSQGMYPTTSGTSDPVNIPQRNQHRYSVGQGSAPQGINGGYPRPMRGRSSPPPRNAFVSSDPLNVGSVPEQQYMSNLQPSQSIPTGSSGNYNEEAYRSLPPQYRADRTANSSTAGPSGNDPSGIRGFPVPNRPPTTGAFDFPVGSLGGPVGDVPPAGSYPSRRPMPPPTNPLVDRRQSAFASSNMGTGGGEIGAENYGSYSDRGVNGGHPPPMQQYGSSSQY